MSWYNNIKKLEENTEAFFRNHTNIDYSLLNICLQNYHKSLHGKDKSGELTAKRDCTQKQKIRHELNCEDLEQKRMILQGCINKLSD